MHILPIVKVPNLYLKGEEGIMNSNMSKEHENSFINMKAFDIQTRLR